jgi:hypothetical protein
MVVTEVTESRGVRDVRKGGSVHSKLQLELKVLVCYCTVEYYR